MFIATWASLVFSPGGATSILSDVAPDGAWTDYFLVSINISPLRGSPPQNPLAPGELNGGDFAPLREIGFLIQAAVLAKAQRRKGREGRRDCTRRERIRRSL
jgi:hypothetical protein